MWNSSLISVVGSDKLSTSSQPAGSSSTTSKMGGFTLVEVLVVIGISSIILFFLSTSIITSFKQVKFLETKLDTMDLKNSLMLILQKNDVCSCQVVPSLATEPVGSSDDNRSNLKFNAANVSGSESISMKKIKFGCGADAPVLVKKGEKYSNSLLIRNISIENLVPTTVADEWKGDWTLTFESTLSDITTPKPIKMTEVFHVDPTSPPGTKVFDKCIGLGNAAAATVGLCRLPWGGLIMEGDTVDAYDEQFPKGKPPGACARHKVSRRCTGGVLDGGVAYSYPTCEAPATEAEAIRRILSKNAGIAKMGRNATADKYYPVPGAWGRTEVQYNVTVPASPASQVSVVTNLLFYSTPGGAGSAGFEFYTTAGTISMSLTSAIATPRWRHYPLGTCANGLVTPILSSDWMQVYYSGCGACLLGLDSPFFGTGECSSGSVVYFE